MENIEALQDIKRYSKLGKLSVFVGAGVSRLSKLPSWNGLVQDMADELGYQYEKDKDGNAKFSQEELLKIPQMYYLSKGNDIYRNKVQNNFENSCSPNEIHDLIFSLHPNHILTTNYDTLLEETAIKFGRNFSILNSDSTVARAETLNYIIKVHGDFSTDFVLKEQDYLDYEKNYILIDNVVKTIFATNLVIFIGYGLNDYNIKLILNWVKNVQSDSFVMPIFIHTGEKLSNIELSYQKGRGLRVIDCNNFTNSSDYLVKYRMTLKNILKFNEHQDLLDKSDNLKYIYGKISGVKNLAYVRREDFNHIFNGEYALNDQWNIVNKTVVRYLDEEMNERTSKKLNYFEDFFEYEEEYRQINEELYSRVKDFIIKCGINGINDEVKFIRPQININNPSFFSDYDAMTKFCCSDQMSLYDKFKKAYYLAQLGDYAESYNCYTDILKESKDSEQWDIYFFSQINRQYLFSIIKQMINYTTGFHGSIYFGKALKMFDDSFIERLNCEMENHELENQFTELPYEFKTRYAFLDDFSKRNCYINKYYELIKEKYEVEKSLQKDTMYFGLSKFDKVKLTMLETVKFIYDNMILFSGFDENKLYIKNALISWLEAYEKEVLKSKHGIFGMISNTRCKFTLTDIILITKNFKKDDIDYLTNKIDLKNIPFKENSELEIYINKHIEAYSGMFNSTLTGSEIFKWKFYSEEVRNLLSISPYFVINNDCKLRVIKFIINMVDRDFQVSDRVRLIKKWIRIAEVEETFVLIENWLIEKLRSLLNQRTNPIAIDHITSDVSLIAQLLSDVHMYKEENCNENAISEFIISNKEDLDCIKCCFDYIYPVLNPRAKQIVDSIYKIENVFQLLRRSYSDDVPKNCDEFKIVEMYLEEIKKEKEENNKRGIMHDSFPSVDDRVGEVAAYMLLKNYPSSIIEKFYGICDEYDFLLNSTEFNEDLFRLEWLLGYSDNLCEKLNECSIQKQIIINSIEKAFMGNSLSKLQLKRLFRIYQIMEKH